MATTYTTTTDNYYIQRVISVIAYAFDYPEDDDALIPTDELIMAWLVVSDLLLENIERPAKCPNRQQLDTVGSRAHEIAAAMAKAIKQRDEEQK